MANKFIKSFNFGGEDNYFPLPFVSAEQNGMVLKVVNGEWVAADLIPEPAGSTLIEFTIDDTVYQSEEGMTWGEWIVSDYNTEFQDYRLVDFGGEELAVMIDSSYELKDPDGDPMDDYRVYENDIIKENTSYYTDLPQG